MPEKKIFHMNLIIFTYQYGSHSVFFFIFFSWETTSLEVQTLMMYCGYFSLRVPEKIFHMNLIIFTYQYGSHSVLFGFLLCNKIGINKAKTQERFS